MSTKVARCMSLSSMIAPTKSGGTRIVTLRYGSSMRSSTPASGMSCGEWIASTSPFVRVTRYSTDGAVASRSRSNSRSSRSLTISMWSRPRNPQRNPKPSAWLLSGS